MTKLVGYKHTHMHKVQQSFSRLNNFPWDFYTQGSKAKVFIAG